jgi:hypothetical protein
MWGERRLDRVQGSGFRVQAVGPEAGRGTGFRVQGSGSRPQRLDRPFLSIFNSQFFVFKIKQPTSEAGRTWSYPLLRGVARSAGVCFFKSETNGESTNQGNQAENGKVLNFCIF